jgi:elongation factor G
VRKRAEDVEGKFVRQSGGKGQYGHVVFTLEPQESGKGFSFIDATKGGVVPREFIPAVEKGVVEALNTGILAGYPVVDVKVTLTFGSYHEVDSSEMAFKMAAIFGFKEAARLASPVILEPIMRGTVQGMEEILGGGGKLIKAEVPLSEMFGYSTVLRSMSQGRATYSMEFHHYAEAPRNVADEIISSRSR